MRKKLVVTLFAVSQRFYLRFKKKAAWGLTTAQLAAHPPESFGRALGMFLQQNGFEPIAKVERHDAYHTLTGFSTSEADEIALQYLCFGNGKRTPYLYGVLLIGSLLLPEYWRYYRSAFRLGKAANTFHHFDFKKLLYTDFDLFRTAIFSQEQRRALASLQGSVFQKSIILKTIES